MKRPTGLDWDAINANYVANGGVLQPEVWGAPRRNAARRAPGSRKGVGGRKPAQATASDWELRRRYEEGESVPDLVRSTGGSKTSIRRSIERAGGSFRSRSEAVRLAIGVNLTDQAVQDLVRRYGEGESAKELADALGIDVQRVRRELLAQGVEIRGLSAAQVLIQRRKRSITPEQGQELRRRYEAGESRLELSKSTGIGYKSLKLALEEAGATLLTRAEAVQRANSKRNQPGGST